MIIDNSSQYQNFIDDIHSSDIVFIPILTDNKRHVITNRLLGIYIYSINTSSDYMLLYNHDERLYDATDFIPNMADFCNKIYVFDKKQLLHLNFNLPNVYDLSLMRYLNTNDKPNIYNTQTNAHKFLYNKYFNIKDVNVLVPAVKHLEMCRNMRKIAIDIIQSNGINQTFFDYNDTVIPCLYAIEKNGLYVDQVTFQENFSDKIAHNTGISYLYTDYNLYTATGRPSNSYGGINFAGLNKEDESRTMIQSRFQGGRLVEFDYSAFHPHIISDMIGYELPPNCDIYKYLGCQYYGKTDLLEEEYKNSKEITFQLIYGGISPEFEVIEYFKRVKDYIYLKWNEFNRHGYVQSNIFKRKIKKEFFDSVNEYKLWNYIIQNAESEQNFLMLKKINNLMQDKKSCIILYTYDAFLFDISPDEIYIIKEIKNLIEMGGKFPTRLKLGKDYQNMEEKNV